MLISKWNGFVIFTHPLPFMLWRWRLIARRLALLLARRLLLLPLRLSNGIHVFAPVADDRKLQPALAFLFGRRLNHKMSILIPQLVRSNGL